VSWEEFWDWWYAAHRSYRLHFQDRAKRFSIHRALDIGQYRLGRMFMVPQSENNLIRSCCNVDRFDHVKLLRSRNHTFEQIEIETGIPKSTASRWCKHGLGIMEPQKQPFLKLQ